ncbi:hypothetical protein BH09MYX1_BH09MYX1_30110 [soil metagenome]
MSQPRSPVLLGTALFVSLGAFVACTAKTSESGVDPSANFLSVSAADQAKFCDWKAGLYGGYGQEKAWACGNGQSGTLRAPKDQAACLRSFHPVLQSSRDRCSVTIGDAEDCERLFHDTPCASAPLACITYIGCSI